MLLADGDVYACMQAGSRTFTSDPTPEAGFWNEATQKQAMIELVTKKRVEELKQET